VLAIHSGFAFYHGKEGYRLIAGLENRESYLGRVESSYGISQWINEHLPPDAKVLNVEEVRMFYFRPEMIRDSRFRKKTRYDQRLGDGRQVAEFLRGKRISYLLVTDEKDNRQEANSNSLEIRSLVLNKEFRTLYLKLRHEHQAPSGPHYTVYEILSKPASEPKPAVY
jgi:hypothetical protein